MAMTDKLTSSKPMPGAMKGGASTSGASGPTGSSRSYPSGKGLSSVSCKADFNPQKVKATDLYVGGV